MSLRSRNQRHSGTYFSATQVGTPSAPARCAGAVSAADHQIAILHDRGGIEKGVRAIVKAGKMFHRHAGRQVARAARSRHSSASRSAARREWRQCRSSAATGKDLPSAAHDRCVALPGDADTITLATDTVLPSRHAGPAPPPDSGPLPEWSTACQRQRNAHQGDMKVEGFRHLPQGRSVRHCRHGALQQGRAADRSPKE